MKIVEHIKENYKGYSLIEGFPSQDLIATITTKYLVDNLKMEKVGHIESKDLQPVIRITNGMPEFPIRIYASKKHKILAILSDQIIPNELIYKYCEVLTVWTKAKKINSIITIAAMASNEPTAKIFGVANNTKSLEILKKHKVDLVTEGLTSGLIAQLLMMEKDLPLVSILGSISNNTSYEVSAKILDKINNILNIKVDTAPLITHSKELVRQMKERLQEVETTKENPKHIMYT